MLATCKLGRMSAGGLRRRKSDSRLGAYLERQREERKTDCATIPCQSFLRLPGFLAIAGKLAGIVRFQPRHFNATS